MSPWGNEPDIFFNHLSSVLYSMDEYGIVIGGGDLNARIGAKPDFVQKLIVYKIGI